jgi:hypothetical protein
LLFIGGAALLAMTARAEQRAARLGSPQPSAPG